MAAWGFKAKRGIQEAPRPASVALTDEQRKRQEEEAAARRAAEEAAKEAARAEEEARVRAQAAGQAEREKEQKRAAVIQNIKFFREVNTETEEWELPLVVFEECAQMGLVDRTLLGWTNETLRVMLKPEVGPEAEEEYVVLVPYTEKKWFLEKYTVDVDVAAGIGLGADTPRNLFEELNFESRTGLGRGQNYARKKIDLTLKHLVESRPLLLFLKQLVNPGALILRE